MKFILVLIVFVNFCFSQNKVLEPTSGTIVFIKQDPNCETINKLISLAFENDEFKNSLHFELEERKPFSIYYQTKCISNNSSYFFIENEVENCLILKRIEYLDRKYYLNIYYPLEGMSINLTYKKKKKKIKLCKINSIEF